MNWFIIQVTTELWSVIRSDMEMDLILACLLILLGSMIAYALDERYRVTARISDWLGISLSDL